MFNFFIYFPFIVRVRADLIKSILQEPRRKLAPPVYIWGIFPVHFFPLPIKKYISSDVLTFSLQKIGRAHV